MGSFFNSKEIAEKCGLHLKTVQRFMREGKIAATKIGREWRVSGNDLSKFMEGGHYEDVKEPETEEEKEQLKFDCKAIIEIAVRDFEEASMYSNMIMGALKSGTNSYQRSDFEFMYYNKECKAKLIFKGDALFIANMMLSMSELEEDK